MVRRESTVSLASLSYQLSGLRLEQLVGAFHKSCYQRPILQRLSSFQQDQRPPISEGYGVRASPCAVCVWCLVLSY